MSRAFDVIDNAPLFDLLFWTVWAIAAVAFILHFLREARIRRDAKRLLQLAEGTGSAHTRVSTRTDSEGSIPPVSSLAGPRQDLDQFSNDHPDRERLGLRRGR